MNVSVIARQAAQHRCRQDSAGRAGTRAAGSQVAKVLAQCSVFMLMPGPKADPEIVVCGILSADRAIGLNAGCSVGRYSASLHLYPSL